MLRSIIPLLNRGISPSLTAFTPVVLGNPTAARNSLSSVRHYNRLLEGIDSSKLVRDIKAPINKDLQPIFNLEHANNSEIVRFRKTEAMKKYQLHSIDTGSPQVQISIITERIHALTVHFIKHRLDVNTKRSYDRLIHRRRGLLKYLKRTNFEEYARIVKSMNLQMAARQIQ
jgi:small subunit ribosomal protein S15